MKGKLNIIIDYDKLKEIENETGINILEALKRKGAKISQLNNSEKIKRFIVLNKGAHEIETALKKQFGNIPIITISKGNLSYNEIEEIAIKAAKEYKEGDAIVLTGPGLLIALTVLYIQVKTPQKIKLVQYDLEKKEYKIYQTDHLEMRKKLSQ